MFCLDLVNAEVSYLSCQSYPQSGNTMPTPRRYGRKVDMRAWNFIILATGLDPAADDFEDRFFEAGCDDATVSFMKSTIVLEFDREARTLSSAVNSAIQDVKSAGADVIRVEPDTLVNMSDIAVRMNITRQAVSLYVQGKRGPRPFPVPTARLTTDSPLWNWVDVARWFFRSTGKAEMRRTVVAARVIEETNRALNAS